MGETTPSTSRAVRGLRIETVEWLPSGGDSGLVRVRGRWAQDAAPGPELPALLVRATGTEHRFESLPDARFGRDAASWRGSYLVPAAIVAAASDGLWLQWPDGARVELPPPAHGVEAAPAVPDAPPPAGARVIDRAVLAERRARRAEESERAQARIAEEAVKAVEVLEVRSAELERRLEEAAAERDALLDRARSAAAGDLAAARAAWESRAEELEAALAEAREALARARESADASLTEAEAQWTGERDAHAAELAALRARLTDAESTSTALRARLTDAESTSTGLRARVADAETTIEELQARLAEAENAAAELRARLTSATDAVAGADARVAAAEAVAEAAQGGLRVEAVARAALEDELDRERAAHAPLAADLEAALATARFAESALAALRGDLAAATSAREQAAAELAVVRTELEDACADAAAGEQRLLAAVEAAHTARAAGRSALDDARAAATTAQAELHVARCEAEEAQAALEDERAARTEIEAALAAERSAAAARDASPPDPEAPSATLQARIAELERAAAVASEPDRLERLAREQAEAAASRPAHQVIDLAARLDAAAGALRARTEPEEEAAAAEPPAAPVAKRPVAGEPVLRRALVRLAADDPDAAGRLLVALLPAQAGVIAGPLAYDLTIRGLGTYGVTIADGAARVEPLERRRPRRGAAFHLAADAQTLAELLAGEDHRVGRFGGPARFRGRRRRMRELRVLASAPPTLAEAVRSGAEVEPGIAWRMLGIAVRPAWTRGMHFTVAQVVTDPEAETWFLTARDGAGLAVTAGPPPQPPIATVSMSRGAFARLLRDEPHVAGDRPAIRGDRAAVAALLQLADRARR